MKKANIILITIFAVVGAILIYKLAGVPESKKTSNNKITSEYNMLDENNVFEKKSISEINNIINEETGIVFFCIPENSWCQYYIKYLNDAAIANNIEKINYLNIKQDRAYNTSGYRKLLKSIDEHLNKDDEGNKKVFVPALIFVRNGNIIIYDDETSMMNNQYSTETYYTEDKINEFNNKLNNYILQYKEEL